MSSSIMVRLKLYIPLRKYKLWEEILKDSKINSSFFTNFSQWVREALKNLPAPGETPLYPKEKSNEIEQISKEISASERSTQSEQTKRLNLKKNIEKVIWIDKSIKNSLIEKKGHLSLNSYVILILDMHVFGKSSYQSLIYQIFQLQDRVNFLEKKLQKIMENISFIKI
ncbi:MAG: hypothetical protein K9W44_02405 [Candidatus Lokiarchaeota archaeon]|nr:hypothetical protein [Candidatus Harpocratesius repetitus]